VIYQHKFAVRTYSGFSDITPGGKGEMWAAGGYGVAGNGLAGAILWRHHAWHATPMPGPLKLGEVQAVSADSGSDAWAVTANGFIVHWNGTKWRVTKRILEPMDGPPGIVPSGVLAVSPHDVWSFSAIWRNSKNHLVGGSLHYNGQAWTSVTGPGRTILTASEASPTDLWAVGGSGPAHVGLLRYGRTGWRQVTEPSFAGLTFSSVLAQRDGTVWAVAWPASGKGAGTLAELSGGHWTSHALPANIQPGPWANAVASDGHGGVWITAPAFYQHSSYLLHFSRGSWQEVDLGVNIDPRSVTPVPGSGAICAAGAAYHYQAGYSVALVWSTGRSC